MRRVIPFSVEGVSCKELHLMDIYGDGTCFFYALLAALDPASIVGLSDEELVPLGAQMRRDIRDFLVAQLEKEAKRRKSGRGKPHPLYGNFEGFLDEGLDRFLENLCSMSGGIETWAGEELWAVVQDMYKCKIVVVTREGVYCRAYDGSFYESGARMIVLHNSGVHYEPVLHQNAAKKLQGVITSRNCLYKEFVNLVRTTCEREGVEGEGVEGEGVEGDGVEGVGVTVSPRPPLNKGLPAKDIREWFPITRRGHPEWVTGKYKNISLVSPKDVRTDNSLFVPQAHQLFVRDYLQHSSPYRGLLLMHGLGTGKTCSSIGIAELLSQHKDVIVMLEARLAGNFKGELMACAHESMVVDQQWKKIPSADRGRGWGRERGDGGTPGDMGGHALSHYVPVEVVGRHGGIWVPDSSKGAKQFVNLTPDEQEQVKAQTAAVIESRYTFLHYNGLTWDRLQKTIKASGVANFFDNKVVIIDEVHNFVSAVVNELGADKKDASQYEHVRVSTKLYDMIVSAQDTKVVALSGTPIKNHPSELAYVLNLVKGVQWYYTIEFANSNLIDARVMRVLKTNRFVDAYRMSGNKLLFSLAPRGYALTPAGMMTRDPESLGAEAVLQGIGAAVAGIVGAEGIKRVKGRLITPTKMVQFPDKRKAFEDAFVNREKGVMTNRAVFSNYAAGSVSYFVDQDESKYPSVFPTEHVKVPMSDYQFGMYANSRGQEIERDAKSKVKKAMGATDKIGETFMAASRAMCNFVFPESIKRPATNDIRIQRREMGLPALSGSKLDKAYDTALADALRKLERSGHLNEAGLEQCGPKINRILAEVTALQGTAVVYSQFRTTEGLGVLEIALRAAGWAEFPLRKVGGEWRVVMEEGRDGTGERWRRPMYAVFTSDMERNNLLLGVFNSTFETLPRSLLADLAGMPGFHKGRLNTKGALIRLFMISAAGSEGISMKNVRQVHIMEPYWNEFRIRQVVGRAVRMNSHNALPKEDRNVRVFVYAATFTPSQKKQNYRIRVKDDGLTADELILGIAAKKNKLNEQFLEAIRTMAVDCPIWNIAGIDCKPFAAKSWRGKPWSPLGTGVGIEGDGEGDGDGAPVPAPVPVPAPAPAPAADTTRVRARAVVIHNTRYIYVETTGELFDAAAYDATRRLVPVGHLVTVRNGMYVMST